MSGRPAGPRRLYIFIREGAIIVNEQFPSRPQPHTYLFKQLNLYGVCTFFARFLAPARALACATLRYTNWK